MAFASRVSRLWVWLAQACHTLFLLMVLVISGVLILKCPQEHVIRLIGLCLQLLGIATVAWGISETRALFGYPSISSKIKAWFGRFPFLSRQPIVGSMNATLPVPIIKARGYMMHSSGSHPTIESRLDTLEKNLLLIQDRITQTLGEIDDELKNFTESLKTEAQSRQENEMAIHAKLEAVATGGIRISAIGAVLLFFGVILSTASVEIAGWLK